MSKLRSVYQGNFRRGMSDFGNGGTAYTNYATVNTPAYSSYATGSTPAYTMPVMGTAAPITGPLAASSALSTPTILVIVACIAVGAFFMMKK